MHFDAHHAYGALAGEGWDGKNLKWGLKPAEKTIVYTQIPDESCTHDFENPVTLDDSWNIEQASGHMSGKRASFSKTRDTVAAQHSADTYTQRTA